MLIELYEEYITRENILNTFMFWGKILIKNEVIISISSRNIFEK